MEPLAGSRLVSDKIYTIAVVGGGSAGTMAVLRCVLNNDETLFFPGSPKDRKRSRAFWVAKVENMPAHLNYTKGIVQPNKESLDWLATTPFQSRFHPVKNRGIVRIEKEGETFLLEDNKGESWRARFVILATGVMDVQPLIGGSIQPILPYANVQLADYCLRCDGHHVYDKRVAIIGHTVGAAWVAIMLYERYRVPSMTLLTHGEPPQLDETTRKAFDVYGIGIDDREIVGVEGDARAKVLKGLELSGGGRIELDICFISLGMIVYNQLAVDLGAEVDERGFVVTDGKGYSSVEGLYAVGDLQAGIKKQIYTAWDSAVDAADHINALLRSAQRRDALGLDRVPSSGP